MSTVILNFLLLQQRLYYQPLL